MANPLYIIPGHGHGDPGAGGGGQTEAENVRKLAQRCKDLAANADDVVLHPFDRNAYAQGDLTTWGFPAGARVVELHQDSSGTGAARGAHVIIKAGLKADAFDNALAKKLAEIFPGRSDLVVGRSDLANPNRASKRGVNYRLAEVGFVDNAEDRAVFNSRLDDIARAILSAAGIAAKGSATDTTATPAPAKPAATPAKPAKPRQMTVDGDWGTTTNTRLQEAFGTPVDGEIWHQWAPNKQPAFVSGWRYDKSQDGSPLVRAMQRWLGVDPDGIWGEETTIALQNKMGTTPDGELWRHSPCVMEMQRRLNSGTLV
mgnify:CR=1 FL=1